MNKKRKAKKAGSIPLDMIPDRVVGIRKRSRPSVQPNTALILARALVQVLETFKLP